MVGPSTPLPERRIVYFRHGEVVILLTQVSPPDPETPPRPPDLDQLQTFLADTVRVDLFDPPFRIAADRPLRVTGFARPARETDRPEFFAQVLVRLKAWPRDDIITHGEQEPEGHDENLLTGSIHGVAVAVRDINRWLEKNQEDPRIEIDSNPPGARYRITSAEPHWLGLGFNG